MRKGVYFLFIVILIIGLTSAGCGNKSKEIKGNAAATFEMIAHRGFNNQFPEDTIYAAEEAMKLGANPECDVQFTADGEMVVIHDDTVDRTTDGTGTVSQLKYSYIAALDAGVKKSSKFAGIRIPKFTDYLDAVKGAKQIYPEIKTYRTTEDIAVFTQTLLDKGFEQKATIQSFAYPITLPEIRKLSRKIRVGALCSDQAQFDENLIIAKKDPNSMMLISTKIATAENLTACKNANLPVAVWTVNTQDQLKDLLALGYDKLMLSQYMEYK